VADLEGKLRALPINKLLCVYGTRADGELEIQSEQMCTHEYIYTHTRTRIVEIYIVTTLCIMHGG